MKPKIQSFKKYIVHILKFKRYIIFQFLLLLAAFFYYSFFANRNISSFDEGYFVHNAERIFNGEIPYKDFFLQYGPTYFYCLVFFYKLLGISILTGRIFSLIICLSIIGSVFYLINILKVKSYKIIILVFLSLISFGFPLINIPNIIWGNVLMSVLLLIFCISFYTSSKRKTQYLVCMGITLAVSLSLKQNLGILYIIFYNLFLITNYKNNPKEIFKNLFVLNLAWFIPTLFWVYYFFLKDNVSGLVTYINFSKNFITSYGFSYPPLSNFFKPLGIFKQIPYYLPIFLFIITLSKIYKKNRNWKIILISLSSCLGFFVSIYPQSDLLHCFPFLSLILVALAFIFYKQKFYKFIVFIILLTILIGFYLTFFAKVYDNYFFKENTYIDLPKTKGIMLTKFDADSFKAVSSFINSHTRKEDYIFVYPYHPVFYFIFDRKNPSKDAIYQAPSWHFYDDKTIISEIKQKRVKYVIVYRDYRYESDLSRFIIKQKKVYSVGTFIIFEITNFN